MEINRDDKNLPRSHSKGQVEFGIKSHVSWLFAACWTIKKAELDHKEGWALKNWCFQTVSPLDSKEIKPVTPKGNHPWIFIGWTDAEALKLWPLDAKSWLIGKDPDAGKDWIQKEKGVTEDEMVGWHHWLSTHEFEQNLGDGDGQGSLVCSSPWGHKELDTTEWLNNNTD